MHHTATVIESQPDWATLTSSGTPRDPRLFHWGRAVLRAEEGLGGKRVPWALRGYAGQHCGHASVGERPGSDIVQLSGVAAQQHLREGWARASNITRLDLAVTIKLATPDDLHESRQWAAFLAWREANGSPMVGRYMEDHLGGGTAYIGSRRSELFLRVYNKEVECLAANDQDGASHYRNCHRYELEMKGRRCIPMAEEYLRAPAAIELVQSWVGGYLRNHGMDYAWITDSEVSIVPGFRRRTDVDTRLRWLETQVQPTCDWLAEHGHEALVFKALGYSAADLRRQLQRDDADAPEEVEA